MGIDIRGFNIIFENNFYSNGYVAYQFGEDISSHGNYLTNGSHGGNYDSMNEATDSFILEGSGYLTFVRDDIFFSDDWWIFVGDYFTSHANAPEEGMTYAANNLIPGVNVFPYFGALANCPPLADDNSQCHESGYITQKISIFQNFDDDGGVGLYDTVAYSNGYTTDIPGYTGCDPWPNITQLIPENGITCDPESVVGRTDGDGWKHNLGASIELKDLSSDNNQPENWYASQANGTPGIANSINHQHDLVISQILFKRDQNSFITIKNMGNFGIQLNGYRVGGDYIDHSFDPYILYPGDCYYLFQCSDCLMNEDATWMIDQGGDWWETWNGGVLSDWGGTITIWDPYYEIVDHVDYTYLLALDGEAIPTDYSVKLIPTFSWGDDNQDSSFWQVSFEEYGDFWC